MRKAFAFTLVLMFSGAATALAPWLENINDPNKASEMSKRWYADGGQINFIMRYDTLNAFGIKVVGAVTKIQSDWERNTYFMPIKPIGGLELIVPYGILTGVDKGSLAINGNFSWHGSEGHYDFSHMFIRSASQLKRASDLVSLELINDQQEVLFYFDNIHATLDEKNNFLLLENMDVLISTYLAKQLGRPELAGEIIGQAHIQSNLTSPSEGHADIYQTNGGQCTNRPVWPGPGLNDPKVDVALIDMNATDAFTPNGFPTGYRVVTPEARLKNVGDINAADVTWYSKFSPPDQPYNNDQHPYLVWNMYREIDDRFEQIGVSGVKHAFLTINQNCLVNCNNNHILWVGCEDIYGFNNNESAGSLGPRNEINAYTGVWDRDNSGCTFFDQDCNGNQDNSSTDPGENRMVVAEANMSDPNATYFVSAWYVVRDDINIFNTMGYKQYTLVNNMSDWNFNQQGSFTNGPASDQYVTPDTLDTVGLKASKRVHIKNEGHLTIAVKVTELNGGLYRYNYMIENHDYDPQVQTIKILLDDANSFTNVVFSDVDENTLNDWSFTHYNNVLTVQAPVGNAIDWGTLYSFSFTSDAEPEVAEVALIGLENSQIPFNVETLGPEFDDLIYLSGFEHFMHAN